MDQQEWMTERFEQQRARRRVRGTAKVSATGATSGHPVEVRGARTWATGAVVLSITIAGGRIAHIDIIADPDRLRALDLAVLEG